MPQPTDPTARRHKLYALLGDLPDRDRSIRASKLAEQDGPGYRLETLLLDLNGSEPVPALFTRPSRGAGPFPAVIYSHAHGNNYLIGKNELIEGRPNQQQLPYGQALATRGIAALCIDHWGFGERRGRSESEIFKEMLWRGQVMWGMMIYDSLRALDYLAGRPDVAPGRIGALGKSMGSTMSWWLAALDTRVRACVDICCLTDFDALIEAQGLDGHGIYYYVPGLLKHFSAAQINALIAPRPHLSLAGRYDRLTPLPGLRRIDAKLRQVYEQAGAVERWTLSLYDVGHLETAAMRAQSLAFLEKWLTP